jgi:hypothetical protein
MNDDGRQKTRTAMNRVLEGCDSLSTVAGCEARRIHIACICDGAHNNYISAPCLVPVLIMIANARYGRSKRLSRVHATGYHPVQRVEAIYSRVNVAQ